MMDEEGLVLGPPDLHWTVLHSLEGVLAPSPLGCTIRVLSFASETDLRAILAPYRRALQAVGLAIGSPASRRRIVRTLASLGVTRVCPVGKMQHPPLSWDHDGRALLAHLVRFVDYEADYEADCEADYEADYEAGDA